MKRLYIVLMVFGMTGVAFAQNDGRSTTHVFPQFADGRFSDGSYYRSALILDTSTATAGQCTIMLQGTTGDGNPVAVAVQALSGGPAIVSNAATLTVNISAGGGYQIFRSLGTAQFQAGYLVMNCSVPVNAQVVFSFYGSNGVKVSEATVFSSLAGTSLGAIADTRDGARFGLAIVNDSETDATVRINLPGLGFKDETIRAKSNYIKFLDEIGIAGLQPDTFGPVVITSSTVLQAIALRFTGSAFTTFPFRVVP